jgi:hypothetical protein
MMPRTIGLTVIYALVLLVVPLAAEAPVGKAYRIGWLYFGVASGDMLGGLRQGLRELGYIEGQISPLSSAMLGGNTSGFSRGPPTSSGSPSTYWSPPAPPPRASRRRPRAPSRSSS